jgi:hypothetical protein
VTIVPWKGPEPKKQKEEHHDFILSIPGVFGGKPGDKIMSIEIGPIPKGVEMKILDEKQSDKTMAQS